MKKCMIVANGSPPKKSVISFLRSQGYETIIAADGGANSLYKYNIVPDFVIGDLDSINKNVLNKFAKFSKVIQYKRQNDTDVEKCLKFAIKRKFTDVVLLGATGDRLDHTLCNLGIILKFFEKIRITVIHESSVLNAYTGYVKLRTAAGEIISVYGFDDKTKVRAKGLKYKLNNIALPFGEKESTSNVAMGKSVELEITGGKMFVIRDYRAVKANDNF